MPTSWLHAFGGFALHSVALVLVLTGCSDRTSTRPVAPTSFSVFSADGWFVEAVRDGSGFVGYGSGAGDGVEVPAGTFDFIAILDRLREAKTTPRTGDDPGRAVMTVETRNADGSTGTFYSHDAASMRLMVEAGITAATKSRAQGWQTISELWKTRPMSP